MYNQHIQKYRFLITGGAGFIGANLVEHLLQHGVKKVRVLDNLATGYRENLAAFQSHPAFEFREGDIRDINTCRSAMQDIDYVSHQAALGSVPRSIQDPKTTHDVNITGFLHMLIAQRETPSVKRMVYAASSATYGDSTTLPKVEEHIGNPLSPYAVTKYVNELYARVFAQCYGTETIGLRYFNVFGPKQSPNGAYAAVIPLFMQALKEGKSPVIHGNGEQTRDFTYVSNAVQANVHAFFAPQAANRVYNIACGTRISVNTLWAQLKAAAGSARKATYGPTRPGDVKDSLADISKARQDLHYTPAVSVEEGLQLTWKAYSKT